MDTVGKRIREIRKKNKDTLEDLGKKIDFNYSNLSKIERGDRNPTLEILRSICEIYDVPLSYFLGEKEEMPAEIGNKGAEWMAFIDEMEKRNLSPDEIKEIVDFLDKFKK